MKKDTTILYVEDNDFIREEALDYLSLFYNTILEATNGEEALEIYKASNPDIIITDIKMPIISGLQLAKYIRKENKKIPIIILTAFVDTEYLLEAIELHLVKYIIKPVTNYKLDIALDLAHQCLEEDKKICIVHISANSYYDRFNRLLMIDDNVISLTHNEILLFELLLDKAHMIVTYLEIKAKIWNYEEYYMDALRSLIRSLRNKIGDIVIKNISGIGYRIEIEDNI